MLNSLIENATQILAQFHNLGYWLAFLFALSETIIGLGMITPGSVALIFLGGYSATGNIDFYDLIFFAAMGAIIGDNINYYLGKKFGTKWMKKGVWIIKPSQFTLGHDFFNKYGGKSVFLGRFIPMVKEIMPFIAGSLQMHRGKFFIFNFLGAIGWAFEFIGLGFIFTGSILLAKAWLSRIAFFVLLLVILFIVLGAIDWSIKKYGIYLWNNAKTALYSLNRSLQKQPIIKKWIEKHPNAVRFIKKRFEKNHFYGLPLTVLIILFIYALSAFGGVVEDFITNGMITQIDERLSNLLYLFRNDLLVKIFLWITLLGKSVIIILFSGIAAAILWLTNKKQEIFALFISVVGAAGFTFVTKIFFHRSRPELSVYTENSFSFPSGHSAIAVAFYGFLIWIFIHEIKNWKQRINLFFSGLLLILLVGISRLYLGVHYLSDVIGGFTIGFMALIFSITVLVYLKMNFPTHRGKVSLIKKCLSLVLVFLGLATYIAYSLQYPSSLDYKQSQTTSLVSIENIENIFKNPKLKSTETITGRSTEPINFIFLAKNSSNIKALFKDAGWNNTDELNVISVGKILDAISKSHIYENAPITPLFWNGKVQDMSFQKLPQQNNIKIRHHIRIWNTHQKLGDNEIFVGTALFDEGIKWFITHRISSDIDNEREALFVDIKNTNKLKKVEKLQLIEPFIGINAFEDKFFTDGKAYLLEF